MVLCRCMKNRMKIYFLNFFEEKLKNHLMHALRWSPYHIDMQCHISCRITNPKTIVRNSQIDKNNPCEFDSLSSKTRQERVANSVNGFENLNVRSFELDADVQNVQKVQKAILYSFRFSALQCVQKSIVLQLNLSTRGLEIS